MSQRHPKKPCAMEGCRAYAQRGQDFCAAHLRSRRLRERSEEALALLRRVTEQAEAEPLADLEVLERELRQLFSARKFFMAWVDRLQADEEGKGITPAQFLRAWNDTTARVVQLLRARRELRGGQAGAYAGLIEEVLAELEQTLPALKERMKAEG
jgi:hypothetical protein